MIHAKLLEFQKKNITVKRDGTNPHFRKSYTTLNEVLEKVKAPLNELGVVIVQTPVMNNSALAESSLGNLPGLLTRLIDTEDDSEVSSFVPFIGATDMQKLGGAITYARRYSLVTLLGLEDEDDDGEAAVKAYAAKAPAPIVNRQTPGPVARTDEPFASKLDEITYD